MTIYDYLIWTTLLFLSGSIPYGILVTKIIVKEDIRKIGSGNIGATNVLRSGNLWAAGLTLLCDFLKGFLPLTFMINYLKNHLANPKILINPTLLLINGPTGDVSVNTHLWAMMFLIPVLGHVFSPWLGFKGGKGIATGLGVVCAYHPLIAFLGCIIWAILFWRTRISSLSSLIAYSLIPFVAFMFVYPHVIYWLFLMTGLVFWTHRDNICRLLKGREPKFDHKKTTK